jgi:hypothetical protein
MTTEAWGWTPDETGRGEAMEEELDICPSCGEEDCEFTCTAALGAGLAPCRTCGRAIRIEEDTPCVHCGALLPPPEAA